jgi:aminomethyltransferase
MSQVDPSSGAPLRQSPLHDRHEALGAKMAEFGGWQMPLEYVGVIKEHNAVRDAVGVFDVSHLGKVVVRGAGAADLVNDTLSNDLRKIGPGKAQYTLCCDAETGGIVDDMIVYLHTDERVLLVPNASNTTEVVRRLRAEADSREGVAVDDHHDSHAVLAVQGRHSDAVLRGVGLPVGHEFMSFTEADLGDAPVIVCRSGYTGERGYELVVPNEVAGELWDALLVAGEPHGLTPCGLGARDTLRTEMGYPLHGQDLTLDVTPNQARLRWAVGWQKEAFWGRDVLLAEKEAGAPRLLRGLVAAGRGIPRPGMEVSTPEGGSVGTVTSGTFSPTLKKGVGLALLSREVTDGDEVTVDVRGRQEVFTVTKPPFVSPGTGS